MTDIPEGARLIDKLAKQLYYKASHAGNADAEEYLAWESQRDKIKSQFRKEVQ